MDTIREGSMETERWTLRQYSQEKRNVTIYNGEWMRKFVATIETHPQLFEDVIGPLWIARMEAQEEMEGLREECIGLMTALIGPQPPLQ